MNLQTLLDRPIAFHRCFVTISGSVNAALMLSQAVYWSNRTENKEGWFFKTQERWEGETGLTRREQETARNLLRSKGLFSEKLEGAPAKMFYKVNFEAVQASLAESAILVCTKPPNKIGGNSQTSNVSETTSENTTEKSVTLPEKFKTLEFERVWNKWMICRSKNFKQPKTGFNQLFIDQLEFLSKYTEQEAIDILEYSIRGPYQGLFTPRWNGNMQNVNKPIHQMTDKEILAECQR